MNLTLKTISVSGFNDNALKNMRSHTRNIPVRNRLLTEQLQRSTAQECALTSTIRKIGIDAANTIPECNINLDLKHCSCGRLTHYQFSYGKYCTYRKCFACMNKSEKIAVRGLYHGST